MLQNSTGTFTSIFVFAALTVASSDNIQQPFVTKDLSSYQINEICENRKTSGMPIAFYNPSSDFVRSMSMEEPVEPQSIKIQQRHKAIEESFSKHCSGFPLEKKEYLSLLSNSLCRLQFEDNISSYNEFDYSIDTIIRLSNGLKLSISQFLDEDIEAPAIFSIHRGKTLLISDEMPIDEMVNTINSIVAKLADVHKA